MAHDIGLILGLLVAMTALVGVAGRLGVPYPVLLVLGGLAIGFVPGLPAAELDPELVLLVFLPPLLMDAAYFTSLRDFRANASSIGLLSVGLVLATTAAVALVAHWAIPGLPWPAAFALGAIVSPPDAVAATSIASRLGLPRRLVSVLEGESLVNDATALVAYRVAVAVAVGGAAFSFSEAGLDFLLAGVGGVAAGLAVAFVATRLWRVVTDTDISITISFLGTYASYLLAEEFHASGVIAVVTYGLYIGRWENNVPARVRVEGTTVWRQVIFLLNGLVFVLIGLQLPGILEGISEFSFGELLWYAALVSLTVIVVRLLWVFPGAYAARVLGREGASYPPWQEVTIVGWAGMRGVVSLAAALALPLTTENGAPFPGRDLILFITFSVILATLVLQGLTLPALIRGLKVASDDAEEREEAKARLMASRAAMERLEALAAEEWVPREEADEARRRYEERSGVFAARYGGERDPSFEERDGASARLRLELLDAEIGALVRLRDDGYINDDVLRRVRQELDLERLRLEARE